MENTRNAGAPYPTASISAGENETIAETEKNDPMMVHTIDILLLFHKCATLRFIISCVGHFSTKTKSFFVMYGLN